ncbi:uncharacterized protein LOC105834577 [Monomorium pharaonis]|uniref:uncharacterized protein LOC105834577 n=1 Tax=Monomorium pharaonis TaxID=307658 RepID=UPI001747CCF0|nr:uncharacterized protein LOC105834577 [Monomorium pharaonis]
MKKVQRQRKFLGISLSATKNKKMSDHFDYCKTIADVSDESSIIDCDNDCDPTCITIKEKTGDELLIELYRERPFLYDKSNINFKDCIMKQNAWIEISKIMIQTCGDMYTPSYCQKRCISMRDQYNRDKRKTETESKSGSAATKSTRFPFFSQLAFLDNVIKRRKSYTNCTKSQPSVIDEDSSTESENVASGSNKENESVNEQHIYNIKYDKNNYAPKMKKRKIDETKELEQTLMQMSHRISNYMEKLHIYL